MFPLSRMTSTNNLKILKTVKIVVVIILIPIIVFYLGIIVPEYLACDKTMFEGQNGIDVWGSEIDCDCENQAFGEVIFQMFSLIICGFLAILLAVLVLSFRINKPLK